MSTHQGGLDHEDAGVGFSIRAEAPHRGLRDRVDEVLADERRADALCWLAGAEVVLSFKGALRVKLYLCRRWSECRPGRS
ncbi:hypothetical protein C8D87_105459 [Lentzea atacamensis]|uniref:Uncharacterized protein n=1 Tax=Lentzea atacamensis TaxID=531938 RepID=A0ABX9E9W3_9PSEU|nr:hypothetical protein [Lentzea atacamensis]RAS64964.1 hypothetical protein C8D87_105459 [Lentzea atacamensis]